MIADLQESLDQLRKAASEDDFQMMRSAVESKILQSQDASLIAQLGGIFREKELWQDAEDILRKAVKDHPEIPSLYQGLALVFLRRDDMGSNDASQRAKGLLETCVKVELKENVRSPITHTLLGKAHELLEEREAARTEYQVALEIDPHYSEARYNLALLLRDSGDAPGEAVVALLKQCVEEDPAYFPALRDLGGQLLLSGQLLEAETYLQRALAVDDNDVSLHVYLGQLKWTLKNAVAAEKHFQRAVAVDPTIPFSHRLLGRFLSSNGRIDDANRELFSAIELDPEDPDSVAAYREFLEELGDSDLVAKVYSSAKSHSILSISALQGLDRSLRSGASHNEIK